MKLRELYIALGIMLVSGAMGLAVAATHPGGGTGADVAGFNDASATTWDVGVGAILPLVVAGALIGGVGGAMASGGSGRGVAYGALAGGGILGIFGAYVPTSVTSLIEATGAAGADGTAVASSGSGVLTDPAMWLVVIGSVVAMSYFRGRNYGITLSNGN